jgi:hypothetical protein
MNTDLNFPDFDQAEFDLPEVDFSGLADQALPPIPLPEPLRATEGPEPWSLPGLDPATVPAWTAAEWSTPAVSLPDAPEARLPAFPVPSPDTFSPGPLSLPEVSLPDPESRESSGVSFPHLPPSPATGAEFGSLPEFSVPQVTIPDPAPHSLGPVGEWSAPLPAALQEPDYHSLVPPGEDAPVAGHYRQRWESDPVENHARNRPGPTLEGPTPFRGRTVLPWPQSSSF